MQQAILQTLSELKSQGHDTQRSLGRIEGTLESHGERLDRIEDREHNRKPHFQPVEYAKALAPIAYGLTVLVLAKFGKTSLLDAASVLSGLAR